MTSPFSPVPTLFVSPKRHHRTSTTTWRVDLHLPGPQLHGDGHGFVHVRTGHTVVQTINGVVRNVNGFGFGLVGNDGKDRPKNFFLCNGHLIVDVGKHRGLDKISFRKSFWSWGKKNKKDQKGNNT